MSIRLNWNGIQRDLSSTHKTYRQIGALCFRSNVVIWSILWSVVDPYLTQIDYVSSEQSPISTSYFNNSNLDARLLKSFIYRKVNTSSVASKSELSVYSLCFSVTYSSSLHLQHVIRLFWQSQSWSDRHTSYLIWSEMHFQPIHKCSSIHSVLRTQIKISIRESRSHIN